MSEELNTNDVPEPTPTTEPTPEPTPKTEASTEQPLAPESAPDSEPKETYSFDDEADEEVKSDESKEEESPTEFSVEWPEGYEANEDLTNMVNTAAREVGVSDKALGAYTVRMIEQLEERHAAQLQADDAALKEAWGKDFLANKKAARGVMQSVMREHGISAEEAKVFANAKGFKVLYALSQKLGGGAVHVGNNKSDEKAWATAALTDKSHPDFKALSDPKDPRHKEVTARYFRAQGAKV